MGASEYYVSCKMFPPESSATESKQTFAEHNRAEQASSDNADAPEKLLPEQALQRAGQPKCGLVSRGGEVPIHQLVRQYPALDRKRLTQDCDIGTVLLGSA